MSLQIKIQGTLGQQLLQMLWELQQKILLLIKLEQSSMAKFLPFKTRGRCFCIRE